MPLNAAEQAEYNFLQRYEQDALERAACEASLLAFFARAWREIDPAPFQENWHHHVICEQLETLARGEIRDLIINIPPRCGKSILVSVCYPAWLWLQHFDPDFPLMGPHCSFLAVSYGATLAEVAAVKMLRLVMGEWYQRLWGERVKIRPDQASRSDFANTAGGERISASIEGGILGRGALLQIIDDPHKLDSVESELERARTLRAIKEGLPTRVTDPRISARILVMQRLHQSDCTDYALTSWRPDRVHVMLPMRFEPDYACEFDPRRRYGQLLWPKVWTEEAVATEESELGEYGRAGQLQQRPIPRGGGIFKSEWIEAWPPAESDGSFPAHLVQGGRIQYPALEYVCACVDTSFTAKQENDRSAMAVLGVFRADGKGRIEPRGDGTFVRVSDDYGYPKILLLYGWAKRLELHGPPIEIPAGMDRDQWDEQRYRQQERAGWGLVEWVADTCLRCKVDHLRILTLGQGHGLHQELARLHYDADFAVDLEAERGDKIARAYGVQHLWSSRQIYAPMYEDGTRPSWCDPLIDELLMFPRGRHDDFVDAICGALRHLREIGLFERREEFDRAETRAMNYEQTRPARGLPYDV